MINSDLYDASVRVRDLPRAVDDEINRLATIKGKPKWAIIRDALTEYVRNHKDEIVEKAV